MIPRACALLFSLLLFGTGLTLYVVPAVYSYLTHELSAQERALHAGDEVVPSPVP